MIINISIVRLKPSWKKRLTNHLSANLLLLVACLLLLTSCAASPNHPAADSDLTDHSHTDRERSDSTDIAGNGEPVEMENGESVDSVDLESDTEPDSIEKPVKGKEEIIQEYITYLSEAADPAKTKSKLENGLKIDFFGMGTEASALPDMSLEEAEAAGLLHPDRIRENKWTEERAERYASVAEQQHRLVASEFGPDAWENVTYTLEEVGPVYGSLGYRIVSTGELISESEYHRLLREYWEDIAEQEGVTYDDIFLAEDEPAEMMKNKRVDIIAKYSDGVPVEVTTISDAQSYRVDLSFHGKRVSDQKYEDFHFIIVNRDGEWVVFQGLSWAAPDPEHPQGD